MKTKFGYMACLDCGKPVVVKQSEFGTLSYSCDECDGNGYCKKTQARYTAWLKRITPATTAEPEKKPAAESAPVKKSSSTIV